ncbi:MAG: hypothetical protein ABJB98_11000 [Actinomycetota bacterium]
MSRRVQEFGFRFDPRYRRAARLFGVNERSASITVTDDSLRVRFGRWRVCTPLTNISHVQFTGPYAFLKTAGPARLGLTDRGLTFATNSVRGVCVEFRRPIKGIDPLGMLRHPNLTVTPADCDGLAQALQT